MKAPRISLCRLWGSCSAGMRFCSGLRRTFGRPLQGFPLRRSDARIGSAAPVRACRKQPLRGRSCGQLSRDQIGLSRTSISEVDRSAARARPERPVSATTDIRPANSTGCTQCEAEAKNAPVARASQISRQPSAVSRKRPRLESSQGSNGSSKSSEFRKSPMCSASSHASSTNRTRTCRDERMQGCVRDIRHAVPNSTHLTL